MFNRIFYAECNDFFTGDLICLVLTESYTWKWTRQEINLDFRLTINIAGFPFEWSKGISLYTTPLSHKLPRELDACGEVDDALHAQPDGFDTRLPVPLTRQKASQAGH